MAIAAMFIALVFGATFIAIPFGTSKIHLGNLACILAGMLCGPLVGGISGAVGMGLNDLIFYGPDTILRTVVVKFLLGFFVGLFFRVALRKATFLQYALFATSVLFYLLFGLSLSIYLAGGAFRIFGSDVAIPISLIVVSPILASLLLLGFFIGKYKLTGIAKAALLASSLATLINVIAELLLKIPLKMLFADLTFEGAIVYSVASLPSALATSCVTIVIGVLLLPPLKLATDRVNPFPQGVEKPESED